ncbi:Mu transposase domain-containing protein [Streptomyces nodosus]|uniref:Mu transposase domain-containing protein n=1 Tax=Streptomyces nodosus TaxID=40318 RepID=UPI00380BEDA3
MAPLPFESFECGITLTPKVDRSSRITVRQCHYSVPARFIGQNVRVLLRSRSPSLRGDSRARPRARSSGPNSPCTVRMRSPSGPGTRACSTSGPTRSGDPARQAVTVRHRHPASRQWKWDPPHPEIPPGVLVLPSTTYPRG